MSRIRIIARLDVKAPYLIKGVHLEGLRKLGDPQAFAEKYYAQGIDEIIYIDSVASLYERNTIVNLIEKTATNVFVPITVGGGIRSVDDARALLRVGADKIAINTAAIKNPGIIAEMAATFGSQCMVLSIQAKRNNGDWECYCDQGREHTSLSVLDWAQQGTALGAGEILLTSVDQEGTQRGLDIDLIQRVTEAVGIPVIASGGLGTLAHFGAVATKTKASAVAIAHALHYNTMATDDIRAYAAQHGIDVRQGTQ